MRLPTTCLVVLVGPSGSGKSYWADRQFRPEQVVSSDRLRAMVGVDEHDQRAGADAFELLDLIIARRLSRLLLTVVDTLGLDADRRATYRELARRHGVPCHAVAFDTPADLCRSRNRGRERQVPAKVLSAQLAAWPGVLAGLPAEGFDAVHRDPGEVELVGFDLLGEPEAAAQPAGAGKMAFGLQVSSFPRKDGDAPLADRLAEVAAVAEAVGFSSLWVMDHVMQIPQVGRVWEDMPESWTTLAWLAGRTSRIRLGTLVSGVTLRNPAHLAKIVATVDVLSGGRAVCGIGLGWWEWEHQQYGWVMPAVAERYVLLEDTLQLLRVMWGPGSPAFSGRMLSVPSTVCYPRPLQERLPILVGGSGERRTLLLAARYGDACNLFGDPAVVRRKVAALAAHCAAAGRDPSEVCVTHLSTATVAGSRRELLSVVGRLARSGEPVEHAAERLGAGTVADQVARYRELAGAGVQTAIVAMPDVFTPGGLEAFGEVIAAFGG